MNLKVEIEEYLKKIDPKKASIVKYYNDHLPIFEKFGIETACVRIASCQPAPQNHRMLATWFSYNDLVSLVKSVFEAPVLGCPIIYGVSNNDRKWANNNAVNVH